MYPHHILPEKMGGNNSLENLYLVCGGCHRYVDNQAVKYGYLTNGCSVVDVPSDYPELIGDNNRLRKAIKKFSY